MMVAVGFQMFFVGGGIRTYDAQTFRNGNMHRYLSGNLSSSGFLYTSHISVLWPLAIAGLLVSRKMG